MEALSSYALVYRARVAIIQNTERLIHAGPRAVTEVNSAPIVVIAIFDWIQAQSVHALIVGAWISIIRAKRQVQAGSRAVANICGAEISIRAINWRMQTLSAHALVNRARVAIAAVGRIA